MKGIGGGASDEGHPARPIAGNRRIEAKSEREREERETNLGREKRAALPSRADVAFAGRAWRCQGKPRGHSLGSEEEEARCQSGRGHAREWMEKTREAALGGGPGRRPWEAALGGGERATRLKKGRHGR